MVGVKCVPLINILFKLLLKYNYARAVPLKDKLNVLEETKFIPFMDTGEVVP
jgi:hypothetical protein